METDENDDLSLSAAALAAWRGQERPGPPDAMQLAAWLDGKLDEAGAAGVESALAQDPLLLDALLAGRAGQHAEAAVWEVEVEAARALVQRPWWRRCVHGMAAHRLQWGAALSAALFTGVLALGALEMGQMLASAADAQRSAAMRLVLDDDVSAAVEER